jgi:sulfite exporter TauE/SafE/plastocyanin domain-containing protein/copper chaperone CopZ
MAQQMIQKELWIQGMMLAASEAKLENALKNIDGITNVKASYLNSHVWFSYDPEKIKFKLIFKTISNLGFIATENPPGSVIQKPPRLEKIPMPDNKPVPQYRSNSGNNPETLIKKILKIDGMTCTSCELRIENRLKKMDGIREVKVSYSGATANVGFDPRITSMSKIIETIEKLDYKVVNNPNNNSTSNPKQTKSSDKMPVNQLIGIAIILLAGYLIIKNTIGFNFIPNVSQNMGYGILFVIGLITSLHCVAMCGGINLSQCVSYKYSDKDISKLAKLKPSLMYNAGRVVSYTVLGGIVGAIGSVVSFSGTAKGIVSILAGIFMVIMGLNMLNIFPWLRKFTPHMPKMFGKKIHAGGGKHGPFYVGLLNGLMPCGPLQAMQIYALGTGNFFAGAASMFLFSLGTVPLMFGFGAISSFLSSKFTHKMMRVSAVLVMILGVIMLNRGFSLSGINLVSAITPKAAGSGAVATIKGNEQDVTTQLQASGYTPFTVQKGIPVRWDFKADASTINGCNGTVTIPQYNISKKLQPGDNEIDFTPQQTGNITYTCSMGMISSTITVVADVSKVTAANVNPATPTVSATSGIGVAKISGNEQDVTVTVGASGYSPAILVLQKGVPAKIKFSTGQLSSCNSTVVFPELGGQLDLNSQKETPLFTPQSNITFHCGMGMLSGYVVVVDDLSKIDLNAIKQQAQGHISTGGGMACCQ